ncbi:MAG: ketoacyl-ACP synthase III [Flavobacterium sp.]|nr:MAG: ketoacyl-ACP synthase III [Flavobacterium sp.]
MKAYLNGISYYLPEAILDNAELSRLHPEWSVDKISQKTGIFERHISADDEFSSDMAISALEKFFSEHPIEKQDIDFLLFCTQSPDYLLPTTACILQDRIGLPTTCGALDFNLGCSGYIYGLGLAKGLIETGQAKNVLLVTSETYTKLIHDRDKSNKTIFGDGASVSLITSKPSDETFKAVITNFVYGTDGGGAGHLIVKNSGIKQDKTKQEDQLNDEGDFIRNDDYLYMNGKEIFQFTALEVPPMVNRLLAQNDMEVNDPDLYIFHQANAYMLDYMRKRCKIPEEKFFVSIGDVGNTVSSTIPIAIKRAALENKINPGNKVLLAGFGVGLSMGATIVNFE